jgi:DNA-binding MarR family transcriptional regulator
MSNKNIMTQNRLDRSPIHLLHRVEQFAGDVFSEEMSDAGLTPRQYAVLLTVSQNEGLSQTALVDRTGIDRSTLADIIRRMLKKGLLRRKRTKEDARAYAVHLTPKGKDALAAAIPAASNADERIMMALPAAEREEFLRALTNIIEAIRKITDQQESHG